MYICTKERIVWEVIFVYFMCCYMYMIFEKIFLLYILSIGGEVEQEHEEEPGGPRRTKPGAQGSSLPPSNSPHSLLLPLPPHRLVDPQQPVEEPPTGVVPRNHAQGLPAGAVMSLLMHSPRCP